MSDTNKEDKPDKQNKPHNHSEFSRDETLLSDTKLQKIHTQLYREKGEPTEQYVPISLFLLFICGALLFWGGFYFAKYSGGFKGDVFDPNWQAGSSIKKEAIAFDPLVQGKKNFTRTCQQCHQANGKGLPGVFPPLAGSDWLLNSEERPIKILIKGMSGPANIEGVAFNGNMPAVGDWKDRDIAAVLTYARQAWDNKGGPISEELVKKVRDEIKGQTKPWTPEEILAQHPL